MPLFWCVLVHISRELADRLGNPIRNANCLMSSLTRHRQTVTQLPRAVAGARAPRDPRSLIPLCGSPRRRQRRAARRRPHEHSGIVIERPLCPTSAAIVVSLIAEIAGKARERMPQACAESRLAAARRASRSSPTASESRSCGPRRASPETPDYRPRALGSAAPRMPHGRAGACFGRFWCRRASRCAAQGQPHPSAAPAPRRNASR